MRLFLRPRYPSRSTRLRVIACSTLACLSLALAACAPKVSAPAAAAEKVYDLRGEIVGVSTERHSLMVHHEEIPGYMPEMTMEFTLNGAQVTDFREGQKIAARMRELESGEFVLEGIRVVDPDKDRIAAAAAAELRQDTHIRGRSAFREVGEAAPKFTLFNQEGDLVSFDRFRGRRVVLNFIFTRCPVATMCPAATAKMARLQVLAREQKVPELELVSITLDPVFDTPPVLKAYASARGIDSSNFSFLTGPEPAIRDLLLQFGVLAEPGENIFKHTLATLLVDRDGRILHRIDGSQWNPEDLLARLK